MHGGEALATAKFHNLIRKTIFVCWGKGFMSYVPNCTIFAEKTDFSKKPSNSRVSSDINFLLH